MESSLILGNVLPDIGLIGLSDFERFTHFEWYGSFKIDAIIARLEELLSDFVDYCEDSFRGRSSLVYNQIQQTKSYL